MASQKHWLLSACVSSLGVCALLTPAAHAASFTFDFDSNANGTHINPSDLGISVGDWDRPNGYQNNDSFRDNYVISDQWAAAGFGVSVSAYHKPDDYSRNNNWEYDLNVDYSALKSRDLVLFNTDPNFYGNDARRNNGKFYGDFDTDLLTGVDQRTGDDYITDPLGHVLIMQEKNKDWYKPDDELQGGLISFSFDKMIDLTNIDLLDIDDYGKRGDQIIFTAYNDQNQVVNTWRFDEAALQDGLAERLSEGTKNGNNSLYRFNFNQSGVKRLDVLYPGSGAIAAMRWDESQDPPTVPEPTMILGLMAIAGVSTQLKRLQSI